MEKGTPRRILLTSTVQAILAGYQVSRQAGSLRSDMVAARIRINAPTREMAGEVARIHV